MSFHTLSYGAMSATINSHGAELVSLRTGEIEYLWQADTKVWARHAPVLFPIVGRLTGDELKLGTRRYPMSQHGFARDLHFECVLQTSMQLVFQLTDNAQTRQHYPYTFSLSVIYTLRDSALDVDFMVSNPTHITLPYSIGWHPAFNWPLPSELDKDSYSIRFEHIESGEVGKLASGLLLPEKRELRLTQQKLALNQHLFDQDALIFLPVNSRKIWLENGEKAVVSMEFDDFDYLGIWSKPGADFVCIEPWAGYASPQGFNGDFTQKPGIQLLPAYSQRARRCTINIE